MKVEINSAADFLMNLLRVRQQENSLSETQLHSFRGSLITILHEKFRDHWYIENPRKGELWLHIYCLLFFYDTQNIHICVHKKIDLQLPTILRTRLHFIHFSLSLSFPFLSYYYDYVYICGINCISDDYIYTQHNNIIVIARNMVQNET